MSDAAKRPTASRAVGDSDQASVWAVYAEHGEALLGYAIVRLVTDRSWAEDIVQETPRRGFGGVIEERQPHAPGPRHDQLVP